MQEDKKESSQSLGSLDTTLENMMFGYESIQDQKFYDSLERRKNKKVSKYK